MLKVTEQPAERRGSELPSYTLLLFTLKEDLSDFNNVHQKSFKSLTKSQNRISCIFGKILFGLGKGNAKCLIRKGEVKSLFNNTEEEEITSLSSAEAWVNKEWHATEEDTTDDVMHPVYSGTNHTIRMSTVEIPGKILSSNVALSSNVEESDGIYRSPIAEIGKSHLLVKRGLGRCIYRCLKKQHDASSGMDFKKCRMMCY